MRAAIVGIVVLLLLGSGTATAGELIINGGFETGDFTDWTLTGAVDPYYGISDVVAHSGTHSAWFGTYSLMYISQVIYSTIPGQAYEASFCARNYAGDVPDNEIQVFWDGTKVLDETDVGNLSWTCVEGTLTATQDQTELKFGFYNAPGWWNLDDVSVNAVPEPGTMILCGTALGLLVMRRKGASGSRL